MMPAQSQNFTHKQRQLNQSPNLINGPKPISNKFAGPKKRNISEVPQHSNKLIEGDSGNFMRDRRAHSKLDNPQGLTFS